MPAETDLPRYEAFVVQPDKSTHWVVAIISDAARTKARRFARLNDPIDAARLADALNSRLLGRPNHQARLRAALDGLPLTVTPRSATSRPVTRTRTSSQTTYPQTRSTDCCCSPPAQ